MSWLGIGLISDTSSPTLGIGGLSQPLQSLEPSVSWNGNAGSGFAALPSDPVRITAKPALRLLTPPAQFFTDTLDVGVIAMANDGGTLTNTFGIAAVAFHYEGAVVTVEQPQWHTFQTERGPRTYFGWWVRLHKPSQTSGNAQLYVEATPRDATMQKRVIGPYLFSPVTQKYTHSVVVRPTQPEVAGASYQTLNAAAVYLSALGSPNPLITISEPGFYELTVGSGTAALPFARQSLPGRLNITASVPDVVIGRADYTTDFEARINDARCKLHLFGRNLTLDFRRVIEVAGPTVDNLTGPWLDGVNMISTAPNGSQEPWRGTFIPTVLGIGRTGAWLTEVEASDLTNVGVNAALVRGGNFDRIAYDVFNMATCVVSTHLGVHSSLRFADELPVFTVQYVGAEPTATLARSGSLLSGGAGGGVWTVKLGASTYTFDTGPGNPSDPNNFKYYSGTMGDGYWFSDVVAWLNTLPGVSAALLVDESDSFQKRAAASGSLTGTFGEGFADTSFKAAPLRIVSMNNYHGDWYQHTTGNLENVIVAFNQADETEAQSIFLSPFKSGPEIPGERDIFFVANAIGITTETSPTYNAAGLFSQLGRGTGTILSHVVLAHNTLANQGFLVRTIGISAGLTADPYCLIKNNVFRSFGYDAQGPLPGLAIDGLHLHAGAAVPAGATDVVIGGDESTLFANFTGRDYRPAGALLDSGFFSAIPFDRDRQPFAELAALGAYQATAPEYISGPTISAASISGTAQADAVLSVSATASGGGQLGGFAPTITYEWRRNGTAIPGQTASTIMLNPVTMNLTSGSTVSCLITATNIAGSASAEPSVQYVGSARVALAGLLGGKTGSGMYDGRAATVSTALSVANIAGSLGAYTQATLDRRPVISLTDGLKFDGINDVVAGPSAGGAYTMLLLVRKAVGDDNGHVIQNLMFYIAGNISGGPANTTVDGVSVTTRGALFTALNDGLWHVIQVRGVAAATTPTLGHLTSSALMDVMAWVVLREDQFADIAAARALASAWLQSERT